MKKEFFKSLFVVALSVSFLAGCGNKKDPSESSDSSASISTCNHHFKKVYVDGFDFSNVRVDDECVYVTHSYYKCNLCGQK